MRFASILFLLCSVFALLDMLSVSKNPELFGDHAVRFFVLNLTVGVAFWFGSRKSKR